MIRPLIAVVVLALAPQEIDHTKDTLDAVRAALAKKEAVLVDVREKGEWDQGHLDGALLVPLSWLKAESKGDKFAEHAAEKLPEKKVIYLHCRSGARVLPAAGLLKKLGYDVRPLKAGFDDLKDAGFPVAPK
ncbi:MAG TPA: rhodanese-like domain-containing protein [Planctomycetota bacterium]|nr:rhodanese-like domain-containing protein [Planctomycetota bacterium]